MYTLVALNDKVDAGSLNMEVVRPFSMWKEWRKLRYPLAVLALTFCMSMGSQCVMVLTGAGNGVYCWREHKDSYDCLAES